MNFSKFLFSSDESSLSLSETSRPLKTACIVFNEKKSIFKQILRRRTKMLYDSHNGLWVTKLRIDSVHFLTEKFPGGWYSFKFIGLK